MRYIGTILLTVVLLLWPAACAAPQKSGASLGAVEAAKLGLTNPAVDPDVMAEVTPPVGWSAEPLKASSKHKHQIWISPDHSTAYGVIYFSLPLPVGPDMALAGFLNGMKKTEGRAELLSKEYDSALGQHGGIRFVADGGLYTVRTNLQVDGFDGWAVYAGTVRDKPINQANLQIAEAAREHTRVNAK